MAKNNFKQRFPHFGIFFIIAITLAIPLTVWSMNNVSTNTQQEAQIIKCSNVYKSGYCPSGKTCAYQASSSGYACVYNCGGSHNGYCPSGQICIFGTIGWRCSK